ncbi:basic amino acid ABC transporter substrate-binding protein [Desulfofalx alkaliphila]|uniref:basic amino acid ABC transporter substrate-binding protein n=1 Tax=Desulfofalx alkaliphila TaxID=105483 RepID=UPI0004E13245|nr:basic amino acid ABC transporter substrate-binding protein [Desulfofalx alkaliphila]
MKKLLRLGLVLVTVMALMMAAVGCGGGDKPADEKAGDDAGKQALKVAFEPTFAPFELTNEAGEYVGFDIDLIKAIAEVQGLEVELQSLGFDGLIPALQVGQVDVVISGMTITEKRAEQVNFSIPYYESGLVIAVRSDNDSIEKPEDLAGKTIAAQIGTTGAMAAEEFAEEYGATVRTFNTTDLVFMELTNGGVDAVINDLPVTQEYLDKRADGRLKIVGDVLEGEDYFGIAVAKDNTELLETINEGLLKLKENGTYAEIYKKWFYGYEPPEYLPGNPS